MDDPLDASIRAVLQVVVDKVRQLPASEPPRRVRAHWSFPNFTYRENGPVNGNGTVVTEEDPDWSEAAERVLSSVREEEAFKTCLGLIVSRKVGTVVPDALLEGRVRMLAGMVLANPSGAEDAKTRVAAAMRVAILDLPIPHAAFVRLSGILLPEGELMVRHRETSFTLRQTRRSDVELPFDYFGGPDIHGPPDAVLEIRMSGKPFVEIQEQEERAITILRLFTNAPVQALSTARSSEDGLIDGGIGWPGRVHGSWRKAVLRPADQDALQRFWDGLFGRLPATFYRFGEPSLDPVSVAHDRFKDAHSNGGEFERCVMNAVMGLEALFFKPTGEQAELTYRLSMRVARYLSCLSYDAVKTREIVEFAYSVRSGYVHGGRAASADKRKIQRQYTTLPAFQTALLDLVKVSIAAGLIRQTEKEEFIDLIDDSMVEARKLTELQNSLGPVRQVLSLPS